MCPLWALRIDSQPLSYRPCGSMSCSCHGGKGAAVLALLPGSGNLPESRETSVDYLSQAWSLHPVCAQAWALDEMLDNETWGGGLSPGGPRQVFPFKNEHKVVTDSSLTSYIVLWGTGDAQCYSHLLIVERSWRRLQMKFKSWVFCHL